MTEEWLVREMVKGKVMVMQMGKVRGMAMAMAMWLVVWRWLIEQLGLVRGSSMVQRIRWRWLGQLSVFEKQKQWKVRLRQL
jgi:hypothetical protein